MKLATLLRLAVTLGLLEVERVDVAIAKISDEQIAAELPKVSRGNGQPPWRIEPSSRGHSTEQIAVRVECVDEPVPYTRDVVMLVGVLERVGHVDRAAQVADAERRVP